MPATVPSSGCSSSVGRGRAPVADPRGPGIGREPRDVKSFLGRCRALTRLQAGAHLSGLTGSCGPARRRRGERMAETWRWPGGAWLALSLVVNVEEGSEMSPADGDPWPEGVDELGGVLQKPV